MTWAETAYMNAPSLHIALISETFPPEINGVANTLGRLVDGLRGRGHRVQLIRPRQEVDQEQDAGNDLLLTRGWPLPGYPGLQWGQSSLHKLLRRWQRQRPDVLYIATEGPLGLSALRAARRLAIPVVSGFHIAELGFGTGLNLLTLALAWERVRTGDDHLHYTTFEAFPMRPDDMERALAHFPEVAALSGPLMAAMRAGEARFTLAGIAVEIITGDVRDTLPAWAGRADAWFLDGFSPAKNPEMWGEALMGEVGHHTARGGSFATYTAAGHVRRALAGAGFEVRRLPGFAGKRHMSAGVLS